MLDLHSGDLAVSQKQGTYIEDGKSSKAWAWVWWVPATGVQDGWVRVRVTYEEACKRMDDVLGLKKSVFPEYRSVSEREVPKDKFKEVAAALMVALRVEHGPADTISSFEAI